MGRLQPLLVSVDLTIFAPDSDDLAATFDHAGIGRLAHLAAGEGIARIESFASRSTMKTAGTSRGAVKSGSQAS
jgi:hypothetical protein